MKENHNPTVSVIITTHNRCNLLPRAIDKVLGQTLKDYELIMVDDASSDNTQRVIEEYQNKIPLKSLRINNSKGANHARNQGLKIASGKYIALLDDDDWWFPRKLERQVRVLNANKNVAIVGCWYLLRNQIKRLPQKISYRALLSHNFIGSFSIGMFRKKDILAIGGLDETLQNAQDIDCWLRLAERGEVAVIPECLVYFDTSLTDRITSKKNLKDYYKNYLNMVRHHEQKMCVWTKQRHYSLVSYHMTPGTKKLFKLYRGSYYFLTRLIDNILVRINIFWHNKKINENKIKIQ